MVVGMEKTRKNMVMMKVLRTVVVMMNMIKNVLLVKYVNICRIIYQLSIYIHFALTFIIVSIWYSIIEDSNRLSHETPMIIGGITRASPHY